MENYFGLLSISIGLLAFASFGCGIGQGILVAGAINGLSRQPQMLGPIQTFMFVGLGFIEALAIYCLVFSFLLFGKLPETDGVMDVLRQMVTVSLQGTGT